MDDPIVITGLGTVCAIAPSGGGAGALMSAMLEGRSGLRPYARASGFVSDVCGWIEDLDARRIVPKHYRKGVKVMARDTQIAVTASALAVEQSGLVTRASGQEQTTYAGDRIGCHIGAGLIAAEGEELASALATAKTEDGGLDLRAWGEGKMENLPPLWMLKYLPNMLACHVTILHGCTGPSNTITFGEASGLLSIGESMRVIERGDADACFTGSAESKLNPMGLLRLQQAGRIAPVCGVRPDEDSEQNPVAPYDPEAPGQLLGEGGGILILERESAARARGARALAELAGFGAAHSPGGLDLLDPEGGAPAINDGLVDAIERALDDAGVGASEVDAIVPHGAGVRRLDVGEAGALRRVFGERLSAIPLVTWVPNLGECMAGNGGLQAALATMCLVSQRLPARLHARCEGRVGDMLAGRCAARDAGLRHVLVCSSSLGGSNAALVLRAVR